MTHTHDLAGRPTKGTAGFSVIELIVVLALGGTLLAMGVVATRNGTIAFRANGASTTLKSKLKVARELALSHQREILLVWVGTTRLEFQQVNPGSVATPVVDSVTFENGMEFHSFPGITAKPVSWCTADETTLNGVAGLRFTTEGQLVDAARNLVNGCFYLSNKTNLTTARSVSLFGSTGRTNAFSWNGSAWASPSGAH